MLRYSRSGWMSPTERGVQKLRMTRGRGTTFFKGGPNKKKHEIFSFSKHLIKYISKEPEFRLAPSLYRLSQSFVNGF